MSTDSTNKSGVNTTAAIIIAVLAVAIIGFGGWKLYNHYNKQNNAVASSNQNTTKTPINNENNQNVTPAQQSDPNAGYVVIKEWGVRFKPVGGLDGLEYAMNRGNAQFTTQQLVNISPDCSDTATITTGIGVLSRSQSQMSGSELSLGQMGNYYYYYFGPQSTCSDQAHTNLELTTKNELKASLQSLEVAR